MPRSARTHPPGEASRLATARRAALRDGRRAHAWRIPACPSEFYRWGGATSTTCADRLQGAGRRALFIFLGFIIAGSFAAGIAADAFFGWFPALLPDLSVVGHQHMSGLSLFEIISGALLGALTLYHIGRQIKAKMSRTKKPAAGDLVLKVPDMTCQHCVATITKAAGKVPGVGKVSADPATKLVILNLSDSADPDAAVEAIKEAGYHPERND